MDATLHTIFKGLMFLGLVSTALTGVFHYQPTGRTGPLMASAMLVVVSGIALIVTQ
jgi:hypothetical protein